MKGGYYGTMYSRSTPISLNTNELVSLSPGNLSVLGCLSDDSCSVVYVSTTNVVVANVGKHHKATKVNSESLEMNTSGSFTEMGNSPTVLSFSTASMLQAKLVEVDGKGMLVTLSDVCVSLNSLDSTKPMWKVPVQELIKSTGLSSGRAPPKAFARGCIQFQPDNGFMAIGLSNGFVVVVDLRNGDTLHALQGWCSTSVNTPIVDVASPQSTRTTVDSYIASVNENNEVLVFKKNGANLHEIALTGLLPGMTDLATCIACLDTAIIIGFLSGAIRICSASAGSIVYDIAAHGRCVTSVSPHPTSKERFSSCGEDQCLNVWGMPKAAMQPSAASGRSGDQIDLLSHHSIENTMLTGSTWDSEGSLLTVGYDNDTLETFREAPARKM